MRVSARRVECHGVGGGDVRDGTGVAVGGGVVAVAVADGLMVGEGVTPVVAVGVRVGGSGVSVGV
jgi:hypothetical protein